MLRRGITAIRSTASLRPPSRFVSGSEIWMGLHNFQPREPQQLATISLFQHGRQKKWTILSHDFSLHFACRSLTSKIPSWLIEQTNHEQDNLRPKYVEGQHPDQTQRKPRGSCTPFGSASNGPEVQLAWLQGIFNFLRRFSS